MLTEKRLEAIVEALNDRIASEIEDNGIDPKHYQGALDWARNKLEQKRLNKKYRAQS
jgi:hypothetical protein